MNYRKFGDTDLTVSEIGFGAWAIGGNAVVGTTPIGWGKSDDNTSIAVVGTTPIGWGKSDDNTSIAAIRKALDVGINFFDTADFYGLGHSEELLGKELRGNKEVIIATKVGHRVVDNTIQLDYSKEYILDACDQSLRRLKRNEIDYYQLHSARMKHFETEKCVEAMELLKQQGKIRHWGLSLNTFHPEDEAEYLIKNNFGSGFQLVFNLINQKAEKFYNSLPDSVKFLSTIYCRNYGQAGSLKYYGERKSFRDKVICDNGTFLLWIPATLDFKHLIFIGRRMPDSDDEVFNHFKKRTVIDSVTNQLSRQFGDKIIFFENADSLASKLAREGLNEMKSEFQR